MTVMNSEEGEVTVWFLKDFFSLQVLHDVKDDCKLCVCKNVTHCKALRTEQDPTDIPKDLKI